MQILEARTSQCNEGRDCFFKILGAPDPIPPSLICANTDSPLLSATTPAVSGLFPSPGAPCTFSPPPHQTLHLLRATNFHLPMC